VAQRLARGNGVPGGRTARVQPGYCTSCRYVCSLAGDNTTSPLFARTSRMPCACLLCCVLMSCLLVRWVQKKTKKYTRGPLSSSELDRGPGQRHETLPWVFSHYVGFVPHSMNKQRKKDYLRLDACPGKPAVKCRQQPIPCPAQFIHIGC